jgi:hypothetical protein
MSLAQISPAPIGAQLWMSSGQKLLPFRSRIPADSSNFLVESLRPIQFGFGGTLLSNKKKWGNLFMSLRKFKMNLAWQDWPNWARKRRDNHFGNWPKTLSPPLPILCQQIWFCVPWNEFVNLQFFLCQSFYNICPWVSNPSLWSTVSFLCFKFIFWNYG